MKISKKLFLVLSILFVTMLNGCNINNSSSNNETTVNTDKCKITDIKLNLEAPADVIDIVDFSSDSHAGRFSATVLQGVINKEKPRVYVKGNESAKNVNLEDIRIEILELGEKDFNYLEHDTLESHKRYNAFWTLFNKYQNEIESIYIYDEDELLSDSMNVAAMLAGRNKGVAVNQELYESLASAGHAKNRKVVNVCDKYGFDLTVGNVGINRWIEQNMIEGSNPDFVFVAKTGSRDGGSLNHPTFYDLAVATDSLIYHFDPDFDSQIELQKKILDHFEDNILVIGWPGINVEGIYVKSISECNKEVVCADWFYGNGSLLGAFDNFTHLEDLYERSSNKEVLSDKVYVSFLVSDGDAWHYATREFLAYWSNDLRGTVPIGWSIPSLFSEFNPLWLKKVYGEATENDEIMQGVAGVSYIQPHYMDDLAYENWCYDTKNTFDLMGITTVNYWDVGGDAYSSESKRLKQYCEIVNPNAIYMGHADTTNNYFMIGDTVCINSMGVENYRGTHTSDEMITAVDNSVNNTPAGKPVFINLNVEAWGQGISTISEVVNTLMSREDGYKYEFVLPYELANLIRSYEKNGASGVMKDEDKVSLQSIKYIPNTADEIALIDEDGSSNINENVNTRFADQSNYWIYKLNVNSRDTFKLILNITGQYDVKISLDKNEWKQVAYRETSSGDDVITINVLEKLPSYNGTVYIKFEDAIKTDGFGASLYDMTVIYR